MPHSAKSGNVEIPIYETPNGKYSSWTVAYRFGGRRHRKVFATLEEASEFAQDKADQIANGKTAVLNLTSAELASFARAQELVGKKPIELVASEWVQATEILGETPIVVAARDYRRRHPVGSGMPVGDAVKEFLQTKATRDPDYLRIMSRRLEKFADAFAQGMGDVTPEAVGQWITSLEDAKSARTRRNYLADVKALFRWAVARRMLADDTELAAVELPESAPGKISPFTPEEMRTLLDHAQVSAPRFLPYLAIRAFSGIRFEEMERLRPEHFHSSGWISMDAEITKTHQRRLVPILPVLKRWLARYPIREGKLLPVRAGSMGPRITNLIRAAGVEPRRNGLRDSFASYRMAILRDAGKVAEETGHSTDVLRRSYREIRMPDGRVITPAQARRWFSLDPLSVRKIQQIRKSLKKPNKTEPV